jgi:hypothetical protein
VPGFQRLAQGVEHLALELRQFIQKQYPVVGEGNFARPGMGTPVIFRN